MTHVSFIKKKHSPSRSLRDTLDCGWASIFLWPFILRPPWSLSSSLAALAIYTAVTQTFIGKKFNLTIREFHPRICQKIKIKSMYNQPNFGKKKKKKIAGRGRQMGQSQLPLWGHRYPYSMCICKQLGHHRPGKHVPITCPLFFFGARHEKVIWTTKCCTRSQNSSSSFLFSSATVVLGLFIHHHHHHPELH